MFIETVKKKFVPRLFSNEESFECQLDRLHERLEVDVFWVECYIELNVWMNLMQQETRHNYIFNVYSFFMNTSLATSTSIDILHAVTSMHLQTW